MKTKYRYTWLTLFIGLLSLHTLSSCVHTTQSLEMHKRQWQESDSFDQPPRNVGSCLIKLLPMMIGVIWVVVCPVWIIWHKSRLPGMVHPHTNISMSNSTVSIERLANNSTTRSDQLYGWNQTLNAALLQFNNSSPISLEILEKVKEVSSDDVD